MLSFGQPLWLLLLLPLPASVFFYFVVLRHRGGLPFAYRVWGLRGFRPRQLSVVVLVLLSRIFYTCTFILLVIALSRPTISRQQEVYIRSGAAILFLLDLSPSMAAVDVPPYTRLERAKQAIRDFMAKRVNDSIGFAGFGSEASLLWPSSRNYRAAMQRLGEISLSSLGQGTAIGLGLAISAHHLSKLPNERKVLVMFTDGSNNTGEIVPEGAAQIIRNNEIEFYIIGMGRAATNSAVITDPKSGQRFRAQLSEGYNPQRLQNIARIAGGIFYNGIDGKLLEQNINAMEQEQQNYTAIEVVRRPLEQYFLFWALLLAVLGFGIRNIFLQEECL